MKTQTRENRRLQAAELRNTIDPDSLRLDETDEPAERDGIIGQDRAVHALQFGLRVNGTGFNVYVAGPDGTGKMTSVRAFLEEIAKSKETPPDWCYVHNFENPYEPTALRLPPGKGRTLRDDMEQLIQAIEEDLPKAFESDEYSNRREEKLSDVQAQQKKVSEELNKKAREKGFQIQATPMGVMLVPTKDDGEPMGQQEVQQLSDEERQELEKRRDELQEEMKQVRKQIRGAQRKQQENIRDLDRQVALHTIGGLIDDLKDKYEDNEEIVQYLDAVQDDILENVDTFKLSEEQAENAQTQQDLQAQQYKRQVEMIQKSMYRKYRVNVVVDNHKQEGAPVIVEYNPTYNNVVGRIEKEMRMGALNTDFTLLKAGALLQANGGYLVVPVQDLLRNFLSWEALKRALRSGEMRIEDAGEQLGYMTVKSLRPEAIPLDVKIVLVGRPLIYHLLYNYEPDFPELFKVKADFDTRMARQDENVDRFVGFVSRFCKKESLASVGKSGVARLLEHAARMAGHKEKVSTKFGYITDIIREACFWASDGGAREVEAEHVQKALDERRYRSNLLEERIRELIQQDSLLIDTRGSEVGQVNGLAVVDLGDYIFGRPSRITASVSPGREGVLDLEREAKLSGPIHSKGVLILAGFLRRRYAGTRPLTLSAQLVFEQSYEGVDGDSASQAELYAILSALAEVPLSQSIAVTGSVNQRGQVQAIGGANQKIEGFFDVCSQDGLTGEQGVIIPKANTQNLMLKDEVVQAVDSGKFHVWAIETVDEGIEILTGRSAGERGPDGSYPADSINGKVMARLASFGESLKEFGSDGAGRHAAEGSEAHHS
jgi:lon-related putative ATP-dependent protease